MQLFILGKQVVSSVTLSYLHKAAKNADREGKNSPGGIFVVDHWTRVFISYFYDIC